MSPVPAVSVVISTCDRVRLLSRVLESLRVQELPPGVAFEVVVVDNNSRDDTQGFLARFISEAGFELRCVFEPRQGVSNGRNAGVRAARAPIIAFTDDDNEVDPNWIATIIQIFERHPDLAAIGGKIIPEWTAPPPPWLDNRHWSPLAILDYGDRPFHTSALNPRVLLTANLALRREVLERLGGFSTAFPRCQDHELLIRLWGSGGQVMYVPELIVRARVDPKRLTKRYHRVWHATHGFYTASMRLQEIIDRDGTLLNAPRETIRLYGTPGFVYRELLTEARRWVLASLRRQPSITFHHEQRLRYLAAYIRRSATATDDTAVAPAHNAGAFVYAHLCGLLPSCGMSRTRAWAVHVLMLVLVGASVYDIVTGREHWPFSPYPMFSAVEHEATLQQLRVVGVTRDGAREIPLLDRRMIAPFDQCRLSTAFSRTYNNVTRRPLTEAMLRDCHERYEALRSAGQHDGPPLQAVRLYQLKWTLDPRGRNVDAPDEKCLLGEVKAGYRTVAAF